MSKRLLLLLALTASFGFGCDDEEPPPATGMDAAVNTGGTGGSITGGAGGGTGGAGGEGAQGGAGGTGATGGVGAAGGTGGEGGAGAGGGEGGQGGGIDPDAGVDVDQGPEPDALLPDMTAPDVGPLDGVRCDPRLNAQACEPGDFCQHVPDAPASIGRCQLGDGCRFGVAEDCPDPARPYCHLKGGSTVCAAPGVLAAGESCIDQDAHVPLPCADGLVCNNSICQHPCTPGADDNACPDEGRCADISPAVAVEGLGLCAPRGCSWFTGEGCVAGQKCGYAIRNDGTLVGSCFPEAGDNAEGAPCSFQVGGGDNCSAGLLCVGPPDQMRFCRQLCDTGMYEAACPEFMTCTEALRTQAGPVQGYGFCRTNP